MSSPFPGPTPPYQNLPIQPENFKPRFHFISNITLGNTTIVTTSDDMNFAIGQLVRLIIPQFNGSWQLNEKTGYVIDRPADNEVVIDIDSSRNVDPFVTSTYPTQPQILPVGDINNGQINAHGIKKIKTYIPGSFRNIS